MTVSSLLYVPNSLDNCVLVPAGEGAEELWPNVLGTNATEVAPGALVGGPGQRGPIQDVESRGPDSLPTRVICSKTCSRRSDAMAVHRTHGGRRRAGGRARLRSIS